MTPMQLMGIANFIVMLLVAVHGARAVERGWYGLAGWQFLCMVLNAWCAAKYM